MVDKEVVVASKIFVFKVGSSDLKFWRRGGGGAEWGDEGG